MSAFPHTDWTVMCNGTDGDQPCAQSERTDTLDLRSGTATDVRKFLRRRGWAVNIPNPDQKSQIKRLDFCPKHKPAPREGD